MGEGRERRHVTGGRAGTAARDREKGRELRAVGVASAGRGRGRGGGVGCDGAGPGAAPAAGAVPGAAAVQEPAGVPAGAQPPHAGPALRAPGHLPGRVQGAAGAGAGRDHADAVPGAAPAPGGRGALGQEGAQQGAGAEPGGAAGAAPVAPPHPPGGAPGGRPPPQFPTEPQGGPAGGGQGLVGRHGPAGPGQTRPGRARAGQIRGGAVGGGSALHGGVPERGREPGPGAAAGAGRAHEERGGGAPLHHLGRVPVPAARHPRPALVLHPAVPAGGRGPRDGPGGDFVLPVPAELLHPGQGLLRGGDERVPADVPAAPARVRAGLPEEAEVAAVLPDPAGHRAGLGHGGASGASGDRARRPRLRPGGDQLPDLRLHRLGAAGGPDRALLGAALPLPQPGGGPGDEGQRAGGHRQRHHRRPDHSLPAHPRPPRDGQTDPGAAPDHHGPDPALGARAGPAALLRRGPVQPVPVPGGFRGAAGPRPEFGGAGVREPRAAPHGRHPRGPPRRQTLLEAPEAQRVTPKTPEKPRKNPKKPPKNPGIRALQTPKTTEFGLPKPHNLGSWHPKTAPANQELGVHHLWRFRVSQTLGCQRLIPGKKEVLWEKCNFFFVKTVF